jgi:predicted mannosyl-3-phosphoglycerate phosphatase (HAD superfamily)
MKENKILLSEQKIMFLDSNNFESLLHANNEYLEALVESSSDQIRTMLSRILNDYYFGVLFWARLIALEHCAC